MNVGRPGCPVEVYSGIHGQPRPCEAEPTHTVVIRWRERRCWVRIFPCAKHAVDIPDAEPMSARHRAQLKERRAQVALAMAGRPHRPLPTSPDRAAV
jgi:hypothetical protein